MKSLQPALRMTKKKGERAGGEGTVGIEGLGEIFTFSDECQDCFGFRRTGRGRIEGGKGMYYKGKTPFVEKCSRCKRITQPDCGGRRKREKGGAEEFIS